MTQIIPDCLVVPIDLSGFLVPQSDHKVLGPTADFSKLPYEDPSMAVKNPGPYLGETVTSAPFSGETTAKPGMHLHWALPDALTHATLDDDGNQVFPAVPNRWLIHRSHSHLEEKELAHNYWIVEGNYVTRVESPDAVTIPLPTEEQGEPTQSYGYLGRLFDLKDWYDKEASHPENYTSEPLTATGYGIANFASYYPNCKNVFGFLDEWEHLKEFTEKTSLISYTVVGWYSDRSHDPIANSSDRAKTCDELGWSVETGDKEVSDAEFTLFYGTFMDVGLKTAQDSPPKSPALNPSIALGQTGEEALSVMVSQSVDTPAGKLPTEDMLNALQLNVLKDLDSSSQKLHGLMTLEEQQLLNSFESTDGGLLWVIEQKETEDPEKRESTLSLPKPIATSLNALNDIQQQLDLEENGIQTLRWSIYADWFKYMLALHDDAHALPPTAPTAEDIRTYMLQTGATPGEVEQLNTRLTTLENLRVSRDAAKKELEDALTDPFILTQTAAPRYWKPKDPVVLMSDPHLKLPDRYGMDRGVDGEGTLPCLLWSLLPKALILTTQKGSYRLESSFLVKVPQNGVRAITNIKQLLAQSVFLSQPAFLSRLLYKQLQDKHDESLSYDTIFKELRSSQVNWRRGEAPLPGYSLEGTVSAPKAFQTWALNVWHPILLQWQASFIPFGPSKDGAPLTYNEDFFIFTRLESDSPTSIFTKTAYLQPETTLQSDAILSDHVKETALDLINRYSLTYKDSEFIDRLNQSKDVLEKSTIIAQSLSGLTEATLSQHSALQLPIHDPISGSADDAHFSNTTIPEAVQDSYDVAPLPKAVFRPLRTGYLTLKKLRVVDTFGQFSDVTLPETVHLSKTITPKAELKADHNQAYLQPKFSQSARSMLRWISADSGDVEMNAHPATNPICGWLMVNAVDYGIIFYDQSGVCVGSFSPLGEKGAPVWQPAPGGDIPITGTLSECLVGKNHILAKVATHVGELAGKDFDEFVTALDQRAALLEPQNFKQDTGNPFFVGRPLAITRLQLTVDFKGDLASDQSWAALEKEIELGDPSSRFDAGINSVRVPTLLGDSGKVDDGVVGYFKPGHDPDNPDLSVFFTAFSKNEIHLEPVMKSRSIDVMIQSRSAHMPSYVVAIVDPRAKVCLPTGSLFPFKEISLPTDHYKQAMNAISLSLLTAPILSARQSLHMPLPKAEDGSWLWVTVNEHQEWVKRDLLPENTEQGIDYTNNITMHEGWLTFDQHNRDDRDAIISISPAPEMGEPPDTIVEPPDTMSM